jgi:NAD(P)-dependent dehydrogenase (short-subunit alcohol dehydrogenase family)
MPQISALRGRITTPFGPDSTSAEVLEGLDLAGKRIVVTGAESSMGAETATALARAGAAVTVAVPHLGEGHVIAARIRENTGNGDVFLKRLDLADPASIAQFTASWSGPLDVLVNHAEVRGVPELTRTERGHELHFAANHLGHFALAVGLHPALAAAGDARIVSVSSSEHLRSPVHFDDLHYAFRHYDPVEAYAQSKTAAVLFVVEAARRWASDGVTANALTDGAATSVLLAASPWLDRVSGRCFEDCNEAVIVDRRAWGVRGVAPYALDPGNAWRLWELSYDLLGELPEGEPAGCVTRRRANASRSSDD